MRALARLSGGQKQRLFIALSLVNDPELVFLDEITTGLDPQARRSTWELIEKLREHGKTVVLVTHFMDEAERLCDRVAIIDHGSLVALDTPRALIENLHAETRITFSADKQDTYSWLNSVPEVSGVERQTECARRQEAWLSPAAARCWRVSPRPWPSAASSPATCAASRPPWKMYFWR